MMKKTGKRIMGFGVGMAALLTASAMLLSGCGDEKTVLNDGSSAAGEFAITKEPTELSLFMVRPDSRRQEELAVWKEIAELTNVSLKSVNSTSISDVEQAFNTLLASGNLPDIVAYGDGKEAFSRYGMEGAFARIDELISDDTPNIKKQFERPEVKNYVTASDGHSYYVPSLNPPTVAAGWFIRQDWLDKLGLSIPTNPEAYYQALKAIRDGDPNGNGQKDEVPYFSRFNTPDDLLGLWKLRNRWDVRDGKVFFTPAIPEFKEAYASLAKWYAEGLIDKEIYTRGGKSRDKLLGDNVGGSTHDWFGSTAQFNDMLKESVPGINFGPFAPPSGVEFSVREEVIAQGAAIAESSEKKDIAIRFMDFIYSETGGRYMNFGIEGEHYDMQDGKPVYKDWVIHGDKTAINILQESGACSAFPYIQDFWYEEQWLTPIAREGVKLYVEGDYLVELFPTLSYTTEEKEEFNKIMTAINTHVEESCQKWIFGTEEIESTFDTYVSQLNGMGLPRAIEIQQAAYDRYLKQTK